MNGVQVPQPALPNVFRPPPAAATPLLLDFDVSVEAPAGILPPPEIADEIVTVTQIKVAGSSVYAREDLLPYFEAVIGEDVTFTRLYEVASAITARYREDGYALSFAFFSPQVVENGVYTISIVEGFVDDVRVDGVGGWLAHWMEREAQAIRWRRPFELGELDELVARLRRFPILVPVQGVLEPSEDRSGASTLVLEVEPSSVGLTTSFDNRNSDFTGPWVSSTAIQFDNLLEIGDSLNIAGSIASEKSEQHNVDITYGQSLGRPGLRMVLGASATRSRPGGDLRDSGILLRSDTVEANASMLQDFFIGPTDRFTLGGQLDYIFSRAVQEASPGAINQDDTLLSLDRIWSAAITGVYSSDDFLGLGGRMTTGVTLRQGIPDIFDATPGEASQENPEPIPSRDDARPENTQLIYDLDYTQPLRFVDPALRLRLRGKAQWNRKGAFASDEFAVGGDFGRGYDSGEIIGDAGFAVATELRYVIERFPPLKVELQPYAFYDFGYVYNYNQPIGGDATLASAGVGMDAVFPEAGLTLNAEFAQPMTRRVASAPIQSGVPYRFFVGMRFNRNLDDLGDDAIAIGRGVGEGVVDLANGALGIVSGD